MQFLPIMFLVQTLISLTSAAHASGVSLSPTLDALQMTSNPVTIDGEEDSLFAYHRKKQFNQLERSNNNKKHPLYYFYKAVYANVCNQQQRSNSFLDSFEKKGIGQQHFESYWKLRNDNYVKSSEYAKAAETGRKLSNYYRQQGNKKELEDSEQTTAIWEQARLIPAQTVSYTAPLQVHLRYDLAKLMNLSVSANKVTTDFVFDTGAGLSVISKSWADSMGLRIYSKEKVKVKGFTGHFVEAELASIDTFRIGNVVVRHPLFLVFADSALSFGGGAYKIKGIIGFPMARALGTITIGRDSLEFGSRIKTNAKNLFVELLHPIVLLKYKNAEEPYALDTGADTTQLSKAFFDKYGTDPLIEELPIKESTVGGAGGTSTTKMKLLPIVHFWLGGQKVSLQRIELNLDRYHVSGNELMGNLGQDLLRQYKRVVISFDRNYLFLSND